jgi:microcystin-dependent protein
MKYLSSRLMAVALGTSALAFSYTTADAGCSEDVYTGTVCFMATTFCPRGYIQLNGQQIAKNSQAALYALTGDVYGPSNSTMFSLPDMRGRTVVGVGTGPGLTTVSRGMKRGVQNTTMVASQMPPHTHNVNGGPINVEGTLKVSDSTGVETSPSGNYLAGSSSTGSPQYRASGTSKLMANEMIVGSASIAGITQTGSEGNGNVFSSQGPRLGLTACIADSTNLFPPHD